MTSNRKLPDILSFLLNKHRENWDLSLFKLTAPRLLSKIQPLKTRAPRVWGRTTCTFLQIGTLFKSEAPILLSVQNWWKSFSNRELHDFFQKKSFKYAYGREIHFFKLEAPRLFPDFFGFWDFKFKAPRLLDHFTQRKSALVTKMVPCQLVATLVPMFSIVVCWPVAGWWLAGCWLFAAWLLPGSVAWLAALAVLADSLCLVLLAGLLAGCAMLSGCGGGGAWRPISGM